MKKRTIVIITVIIIIIIISMLPIYPAISSYNPNSDTFVTDDKSNFWKSMFPSSKLKAELRENPEISIKRR